jgi:hypothetical protein
MNRVVLTLAALGAVAPAASADVFPTTPHVAFNSIQFGAAPAGIPTHHQVFASTLFSTISSGLRVEITSVAFAPNSSLAGNSFNLGQVTINFGYTSLLPGQPAPLGLAPPAQGGGGAPNASGAMTAFYDDPNTVVAVVAGGAGNFGEMVFEGEPFLYDPDLGNLLMEIVTPTPATGDPQFGVSRASGSAESSRSFSGSSFGAVASPSSALRVEFTFTVITECDPDLTAGAVAGQPGYGIPNGVLNNDDFFYYLAQFAAGNVAVADLTTGAVAGQPGYAVPNGIINNDDFFYYLALFAAGC